MAYLNWKQNLGIGNLTPEKAKTLLKNFRYPTEIDNKGRLLIDAGMTKFVIAFQENGPDSTLIGVSHFKMKPLTLIIALILLCAFVVPGFIFTLILNSKRKAIYLEAVRLMNQNSVSVSPNTVSEDPTSKIKKIKGMLDEGLITQEEFEKKKEGHIIAILVLAIK